MLRIPGDRVHNETCIFKCCGGSRGDSGIRGTLVGMRREAMSDRLAHMGWQPGARHAQDVAVDAMKGFGQAEGKFEPLAQRFVATAAKRAQQKK